MKWTRKRLLPSDASLQKRERICWADAAEQHPRTSGNLPGQSRASNPILPARKSISALSSARGFLHFTENQPLFIVGERINPTGKKALQQELTEGKMSIIRQMAAEQEKQGANLLDINVGQPGIDEVKTIKEVIGLLTTTTKLPLVVDSSRYKNN